MLFELSDIHAPVYWQAPSRIETAIRVEPGVLVLYAEAGAFINGSLSGRKL
jgi:hypothetical protein